MIAAGEPHQWALQLDDEDATRDLARTLAVSLRPNDFITLSGGLGAGKTAFARALIRNLTGDPTLEVPSPTFSIVQTYDAKTCPIVHADLYRLGGPDELAGIGWEETAEGAIVLLEWPERIDGHLPADRLDIRLDLAATRGPNARQAVLTGHGTWAAALPRIAAVGAFLDRLGWRDATRAYMQGDASTRLYERLTLEDRSAILMNWPRRRGGQPVKFGRTYAEIAHIAEGVGAFIAMANALKERGLSAPTIYGADTETGLLLLEDLGSTGVVDETGPIPERYTAAVDVLVALHSTELPTRLPIDDHTTYFMPPFDRPALEIEIEQLLDWYFPHIGLPSPSQRVRDAFIAAWREPLDTIIAGPKTWLLRDFHSPNLIWLPEREGNARVGLIDFQDAMLGSPAYDLASLAMDARVTVPEALELQLVSRYVMGRRKADPDFDMAGFARDYAIMGAQRLTKILGIFARLDRRDGKPQYLRHLPRVQTYLLRALAHPALATVKAWYDAHVFRVEERESDANA